MAASTWGLYVVFQYLWCAEVSLSRDRVSIVDCSVLQQTTLTAFA